MTGTAQAAKASFIRFPNDSAAGGVANAFGVAKVALTSTHAQWTFPATWSGRVIHLYSDTAAAVPQVAFSTTTGREVSTAAAAAANGAVSSTAGMPVPTQTIVPVQLPKWDKQETGYLIGESATSTTLYLWLADGV